jgi:hypothetical protein
MIAFTLGNPYNLKEVNKLAISKRFKLSYTTSISNKKIPI